MATLESKKAATLGKRSIIGMILGLALGAILCFVPNAMSVMISSSIPY